MDGSILSQKRGISFLIQGNASSNLPQQQRPMQHMIFNPAAPSGGLKQLLQIRDAFTSSVKIATKDFHSASSGSVALQATMKIQVGTVAHQSSRNGIMLARPDQNSVAEIGMHMLVGCRLGAIGERIVRPDP